MADDRRAEQNYFMDAETKSLDLSQVSARQAAGVARYAEGATRHNRANTRLK